MRRKGITLLRDLKAFFSLGSEDVRRRGRGSRRMWRLFFDGVAGVKGVGGFGEGNLSLVIGDLIDSLGGWEDGRGFWHG